MRELSKINPNWKRPADWSFEMDWGSPAWEAKMELIEERRKRRTEIRGFIYCPKCDTGHTAKTLSCRGCEYKKLAQ